MYTTLANEDFAFNGASDMAYVSISNHSNFDAELPLVDLKLNLREQYELSVTKFALALPSEGLEVIINLTGAIMWRLNILMCFSGNYMDKAIKYEEINKVGCLEKKLLKSHIEWFKEMSPDEVGIVRWVDRSCCTNISIWVHSYSSTGRYIDWGFLNHVSQ